MSRGAVSQWLRRAREGGGREAVRTMPRAGRQPKLTEAHRAQIPALLTKGAEAHGFVGDVWTTERVAVVIKRAFDVGYHPAHVSRLLRQLGWAVQKPVVRATQRNEAAVTAWRDETWPALSGKPTLRSVPSSLEMRPGSIRCRSWRGPMLPAVGRHSCVRRWPMATCR